MLAKAKLFAADPGHIFDFSGTHPAEIFNESVVPRVNSFLDLLGDDPSGLEDARERRDEELTRRTEEDMFAQQQDDDFLASLRTPDDPVDFGDMAIPEIGDYDNVASSEPRGASAPAMSTPAKGMVDFIKHFEAGGAKGGFHQKAYWDYGQWSIGYGTRAKPGEVIDKDEAERRLASELSKHRSRVENLNKKHGYNFAPHQLDALTSFDYNTGRLEQLTDNGKRDKETIAAKILEYRKAGGKVLKGLERRRRAEQQLFTQGY